MHEKFYIGLKEKLNTYYLPCKSKIYLNSINDITQDIKLDYELYKPTSVQKTSNESRLNNARSNIGLPKNSVHESTWENLNKLDEK